MKRNKLSPTNLKNTLYRVLNLVVAGGMDPKAAQAVASQSREISRIDKLEFDKFKFKRTKSRAKKAA